MTSQTPTRRETRERRAETSIADFEPWNDWMRSIRKGIPIWEWFASPEGTFIPAWPFRAGVMVSQARNSGRQAHPALELLDPVATHAQLHPAAQLHPVIPARVAQEG